MARRKKALGGKMGRATGLDKGRGGKRPSGFPHPAKGMHKRGKHGVKGAKMVPGALAKGGSITPKAMPGSGRRSAQVNSCLEPYLSESQKNRATGLRDGRRV